MVPQEGSVITVVDNNFQNWNVDIGDDTVRFHDKRFNNTIAVNHFVYITLHEKAR